jgi:hypothetical protein
MNFSLVLTSVSSKTKIDRGMIQESFSCSSQESFPRDGFLPPMGICANGSSAFYVDSRVGKSSILLARRPKIRRKCLPEVPASILHTSIPHKFELPGGGSTRGHYPSCGKAHEGAYFKVNGFLSFALIDGKYQLKMMSLIHSFRLLNLCLMQKFKLPVAYSTGQR